MNALEMMAQSVSKQFADRLPELIAKAVENLPPDVLANVGQIRDIVSSYKAQLDRIENQQLLIMTALKISGTDLTKETTNDDRKRNGPDGSIAPSV